MTAVLITGMSGVGKSTVLAAVAQGGHRVVDCDDGTCSEQVPSNDGRGTQQLWHEDAVARLPAEPRAGYLFPAGCAANQVLFLRPDRGGLAAQRATRDPAPPHRAASAVGPVAAGDGPGLAPV